MSRNRSDVGGAGTTGESTGTTSSATSTGGSLGNMAPGSEKGTGGTVQNAAPTDAPASAPQSGTPAFAKPGETSLDAGSQEAGETIQQASTLYPLRLIVDNHTHAGKQYGKGQTIALDAAEYRFAIQNKLGEPGLKEDVGLPVDDAGNAIKPTAPPVIELPKDQAIALDELSAQGTLQAVEDAARPKEDSAS